MDGGELGCSEAAQIDIGDFGNEGGISRHTARGGDAERIGRGAHGGSYVLLAGDVRAAARPWEA
jgi:hypothetical protein